MCCKDEHGRAKVRIPLGVGTPLEAADQVEFVRWAELDITNEEAALKFREWLKNTVSSTFYDVLVRRVT